MKRQPKKIVYSIKRYYSFFHWKQCYKCKLEFKRFGGWKCKSKSFVFFVCISCFPTRNSLGSYIIKLLKNSEREKINYITT